AFFKPALPTPHCSWASRAHSVGKLLRLRFFAASQSTVAWGPLGAQGVFCPQSFTSAFFQCGCPWASRTHSVGKPLRLRFFVA
ncbi:MAG: hypothetical protein ACOX83_12360, partial [Candidatus Spyradocola sp.]